MRYCDGMKPSSKILKYFSLILVNGFFWVAVYFFYTYFLGYGSSNTEYVNLFSANLMPVTILLSYFVILVLIPKYLLSRKYVLFALYGVYTFIVSFAVILISIFYGLIFSSYLKDADSLALTKSLPLIILGVYFVVIVATMISLFFYSYRSNLRNEDLRNKFLQTQLQLKEQELRFLKMQIHPHFLFNSLNVIYGSALQKKDQTPDMILKLSNLLDYILYQVEKPKVLLIDELNHISDYIDLEKVRFHDTLKVEFNRENIDETVAIAPMLLIPFVENSFKHGAIVEGCLQVFIDIKILKGLLIFEIRNTIKSGEVSAPGIGLENIRKRLELLYQDRNSLTIEEEGHFFKVRLEVELEKQNSNR